MKYKDLMREMYGIDSLANGVEVPQKYIQTLIEAAKHGFDLTDFNPNAFQKVLKGVGIKPKAIRGDEVSGKKQSGWVWKGNGIMIVTGNNPITGEYHSQGKDRKPTRKSEKGYASYIGIEGKKELVLKAVELIKKYASYIKNEQPGKRGYI